MSTNNQITQSNVEPPILRTIYYVIFLDTVEKHLVRDHGQEPQFTCEICGSKIIHHKDFQQHMKSHRNPERKCPLCPLKFITKG